MRHTDGLRVPNPAFEGNVELWLINWCKRPTVMSGESLHAGRRAKWNKQM